MCGEGEGESVGRGGGGECVEGRRGRVCGVDSVELGLREWKEGKEGGGSVPRTYWCLPCQQGCTRLQTAQLCAGARVPDRHQ